MNIRTASLLTALLFLATPLALVPSAQAQEQVTDCVEGEEFNPENGECVAGGVGGGSASCVDTHAVQDQLWLTMCAIATGQGATLSGLDSDQDGRKDTAVKTVTVPLPGAPGPGPQTQNVHIQLDFFRNDNNDATNDEIYALEAENYRYRVDVMIYAPTGALQENTASLVEYYLTDMHTYTAPDGADSGSEPDQVRYDLALIRVTPAGYTFTNGNSQVTWPAGTFCVACVDASANRIAFGGYGSRTGQVAQSNQYLIDVDVPGVEDSILEASNITTVLYLSMADRRDVKEPNAENFFDLAPARYPDGTYLSLKDIHIKDPQDPQWRINFQFRSDVDDDGSYDYLEIQCGSNPTGPSNCEDFDGDKLMNVQEAADHYPEIDGVQTTDPYDTDSDDDGLLDNLDSDPLAKRDRDSDGLNNEFDNCPDVKNTGGSPPNGPLNTASKTYQRDLWGTHSGTNFGDHCEDTDSDGILDYIEDDTLNADGEFGTIEADPTPSTARGSGTGAACTHSGDSDPTDDDTDNDGLKDGEEDANKNGGRTRDTDSSPSLNDCQFTETDPNNADSDGDGIQDGPERKGTYAWNGVGAHPGALHELVQDEDGGDGDGDDLYDGDGIKDGDEVLGVGNIYCKPVGGISILVSDPMNPCTAASTSPLTSDTDADDISDSDEKDGTDLGCADGPASYKTDPNNADTDSDTFRDYDEQCPWIARPLIEIPDITAIPSDPTRADSKPGSILPPLPDPNEIFDPNEPRPDPTAVTDPNCYMNETGKFTDECYTSEGPLGELDQSDMHDTDDDGVKDDSNNQIDIVEQRVFYYDLDESSDTNPTGYEGTNGATFVVYQPRVGGVPTIRDLYRVGDVSASDDIQEILVYEEYRENSPKYISCIYLKGTELRTAGFSFDGYALDFALGDDDADPHIGNEFPYAPNAPEPCGPSSAVLPDMHAINDLLAGADPMSDGFLDLYDFAEQPWIQLTDGNDDGQPDGARVALPNPADCEASPDAIWCHSQIVQDVNGIPNVPDVCTIDDSLPVVCGGDAPTADDVLAALCEEGVEDACPAEPDPCDENPELPECQPDPCDEDPNAPGCESEGCGEDPVCIVESVPDMMLEQLCVMGVPSPVCEDNPGPGPLPGDDPFEQCGTPSTLFVRVCRNGTPGTVTSRTGGAHGEGGLALEIKIGGDPFTVNL